MERPIISDPNVLEKLYQRFDYLQDLPCELRGCFMGSGNDSDEKLLFPPRTLIR